jgi:two-component system response regulator PilR (NtrC family)
MKKPLALIVDDEPDILELLTITLGRMGIDTISAENLTTARQQLKQNPDMCLTDMRLPDGDGIDLVKFMQTQYPEIPVAVITAHGNMELAVESLKAGAFDFVSKPVDLQVLRKLVASALKLSEVREDAKDTLLGESEVINKVRIIIKKLARSQAPVYISGESGTGKELIARLIHLQGPRAEKLFVPINCGAIPSELMESEFFGHIKGSFTGAISDKQGLFQAADGGTLFLDEVAELPLNMQVKLLRAIQERRIKPVGSEVEIAIDVRILSATHKNLAALVEEGEFRQDMYYRLNVIEVHAPALRERKDDILLLAAYILNKLAKQMEISAPAISSEALKALKGYHFPGNVRELENILERAITLCDEGGIKLDDLQLMATQQDAIAENEEVNLEAKLENLERKEILSALEETNGNKTAAAKLLGLSFRSLRYRLEKLGME